MFLILVEVYGRSVWLSEEEDRSGCSCTRDPCGGDRRLVARIGNKFVTKFLRSNHHLASWHHLISKQRFRLCSPGAALAPSFPQIVFDKLTLASEHRHPIFFEGSPVFDALAGKHGLICPPFVFTGTSFSYSNVSFNLCVRHFTRISTIENARTNYMYTGGLNRD